MTTAAPTDRQVEVLRLVHAGENLRAIGNALGMTSTNGPADHIRALVRKGLVIEAKPYAKVGRLKLTAAGLAAIGLRPCVGCGGSGCVPAGIVPEERAKVTAADAKAWGKTFEELGVASPRADVLGER